jgi:tRNA pseudouridine13 synthase
MYVHGYQSFVWNSMASKRLELLPDRATVGDLVIPRDDTSVAPVLIESEEEAARYSIYDVVLPMPGFDVVYPTHAVGREAFAAFVESGGFDGAPENAPAEATALALSFENIAQPHKVRDFALPGAYRHVVAEARNVVFRVRSYSDDDDLIPSDQNLFKGLPAKPALDPFADDQPEVVLPSSPNEKVALLLRFELNKSTYATMLFRELMRDVPRSL